MMVVAYDYGSSGQQGSGSGFPGGFPQMGDGGFGGPEGFGLPSRFGQKEVPDEKPVDIAAVIKVLGEESKIWLESKRLEPEKIQRIINDIVQTWNEGIKAPSYTDIQKMIEDIESSDQLLAQEIKNLARQLLSKSPNIPELTTNSYYTKELSKSDEPSIETRIEDVVDTKPAISQTASGQNIQANAQPQTQKQIPSSQPIAENPSQISTQNQASEMGIIRPDFSRASLDQKQMMTLENNQDKKIPIAQSQPKISDQKLALASKPKKEQLGIIQLPIPKTSNEIQSVDLSNLDQAA